MTDCGHAATAGTYRVSPNVACANDGTWCLTQAQGGAPGGSEHLNLRRGMLAYREEDDCQTP